MEEIAEQVVGRRIYQGDTMAGLTVDDLAPAPYNPREIDDENAEGLRESVARFGDISGITYNVRTKRLVCGHQRVRQLVALGAQVVDGAIQLASGHRFPIRVVDWTEAEEKAANVTANNDNIAGRFTSELDALLEEIRGSLGEPDFGTLRLDSLLRRTAEDLSFPDDSPDEEPSSDLAAVEVKCVRGDLPRLLGALQPLRDDERYTINIS